MNESSPPYWYSCRTGVTNLFETESYFLGTDFAKGYQFDTHFWNSQFAQFTFNYMLLLIINDIHLRQGSPTRCPQVVKCLSTLCHFAVATVAPQMRHTQAPFTVVKINLPFIVKMMFSFFFLPSFWGSVMSSFSLRPLACLHLFVWSPQTLRFGHAHNTDLWTILGETHLV